MKTITLIILAILSIPQILLSKTTEGKVDTLGIKLEDITLHAVLSKPIANKKTPIALIIAGSGPTDLNGNQPGVMNNSLKYLSDALLNKNIATLRFDKRGIGKSSYPNLDESKLTIDQYAKDVISIINYLKENGYPDIYVIGHSEGSIIGLIAIQQIEVKGFISIAGAGQSIDKVIKKQLKPQLPQEMFNQVEVILDSMKNGFTVKNTPAPLYALFRPSIQPYLISWIKYNPADLLKNYKAPILIIQGTKDLQVDMEEANALAKANPKAKLVIIDNMNHILKSIPGEIQENMQSYSNPDLPIHQKLTDSIVDFIFNL